MSCRVITSSWIFFLCLLLVSGFFSYLVFMRFCKSVATLQGREAEYHSNDTNDDVGTNDFVREQYGKISNGTFDDIDNRGLVSLGWKIRRWFGVQIFVLVILIAFGIWIQSVGCF